MYLLSTNFIHGLLIRNYIVCFLRINIIPAAFWNSNDKLFVRFGEMGHVWEEEMTWQNIEFLPENLDLYVELFWHLAISGYQAGGEAGGVTRGIVRGGVGL